MSAARAEILSRIASARGGTRPQPVPRRYRRAGERDPETRAELFCARAADYRAQVHRVAAGELEEALAAR